MGWGWVRGRGGLGALGLIMALGPGRGRRDDGGTRRCVQFLARCVNFPAECVHFGGTGVQFSPTCVQFMGDIMGVIDAREVTVIDVATQRAERRNST